MVWNIYGLYGPREKWARGIKPKLHKRRCIKYDEYELNFTHFLIRQEHCFSCDYFLFIWLIPFTWSESRGSKPLSPFCRWHLLCYFWVLIIFLMSSGHTLVLVLIFVQPTMASKVYTYQTYKHHENSNLFTG